MNNLKEDYQLKINTIERMLKEGANSSEERKRLKTKVGCYRTFLTDVNRALNIDPVMLCEIEVKPLQKWRHKKNDKCTVLITKVNEVSGAISVTFTGEEVEKYGKFIKEEDYFECKGNFRSSFFAKKSRMLNYELMDS